MRCPLREWRRLCRGKEAPGQGYKLLWPGQAQRRCLGSQGLAGGPTVPLWEADLLAVACCVNYKTLNTAETCRLAGPAALRCSNSTPSPNSVYRGLGKDWPRADQKRPADCVNNWQGRQSLSVEERRRLPNLAPGLWLEDECTPGCDSGSCSEASPSSAWHEAWLSQAACWALLWAPAQKGAGCGWGVLHWPPDLAQLPLAT